MDACRRGLVPVVAAVLTLTACAPGGGEDRGSGPDPAIVVDLESELIATAVDDVARASTARFEMAVAYEGVPGLDGATIRGEGAYDREVDAARVAVDLHPVLDAVAGSGGVPADFDGRVEMITIGTDVYLSSGLLKLGPGTDATWVRLPIGELADRAGLDGSGLDWAAPGRGFDPQAALEQLRAVADIEEVGREEIRGVATRHLRGEIPMADAIAELDGAQQDALTSLYGGDLDGLAALTVPVDVYVDDEGLLRRMAQRVELGSLATAFGDPDVTGSIPAEAGAAAMTVVVDYFDVGAPLDITAPPDAVDLFELLGSPFPGLDPEVD